MENEIIEEGIKNEIMAYNRLHDFFFQEHGLILLNSEMDEIMFQCKEFEKRFNEGK